MLQITNISSPSILRLICSSFGVTWLRLTRHLSLRAKGTTILYPWQGSYHMNSWLSLLRVEEFCPRWTTNQCWSDGGTYRCRSGYLLNGGMQQ